MSNHRIDWFINKLNTHITINAIKFQYLLVDFISHGSSFCQLVSYLRYINNTIMDVTYTILCSTYATYVVGTNFEYEA